MTGIFVFYPDLNEAGLGVCGVGAWYQYGHNSVFSKHVLSSHILWESL